MEGEAVRTGGGMRSDEDEERVEVELGVTSET